MRGCKNENWLRPITGSSQQHDKNQFENVTDSLCIFNLATSHLAFDVFENAKNEAF